MANTPVASVTWRLGVRVSLAEPIGVIWRARAQLPPSWWPLQEVAYAVSQSGRSRVVEVPRVKRPGSEIVSE
ncbi:hypothetical protein ACFQ0M_36810 [Kitasatospora aburaviensis]